MAADQAEDETQAGIARALGISQAQVSRRLKRALDTLREQVQAVGWVKEARVVRLLPDTLIVEVKEHDRLAVWQVDGQIKVIDAGGMSVEVTRVEAPTLTFDQLLGFSKAATRTVFGGGVGSMLSMAKSNLRNIPRPQDF